MEQENISYGNYLKSIRDEKGISIDQIVRESKIPLDILIAIENEDRERLPDDVFIRGFIRIYSEITGADADLAITLFNDREGHEVKRKNKDNSPGDRTPETSPLLKQIVMILVFLGIVLGSYFGIQYMSNSHTDETVPVVDAPLPESDDIPREEDTAEQDVPETVVTEPSVSEEKNLETEETTITVPDEPEEEEIQEPEKPEPTVLKLNIKCIEKTWLKIIADGEKPVEHVMKIGDTLNLEAQTDYNILIGNASGVKLELDGKHIPVPGKSGQVVNINLP